MDLVCSNGIIHVVDEVILFEENEDRADLEVSDQSVTPQASIIAAIQQGVPLYNHDYTGAHLAGSLLLCLPEGLPIDRLLPNLPCLHFLQTK